MTSEICECHFYYCSFILISIPLISGDGINKRNLSSATWLSSSFWHHNCI